MQGESSKKPRRWMRFSLRAFIAVVALCGFAIMPVAIRMIDAQRKSAAVRQLRAAGATVYYDSQMDSNDAPMQAVPDSWQRNLFGDDFVDQVVWVNMDHRKPNPNVLETLSPLTEIRGLSLPSQPIDGADLRHLAPLKKIEFLDLQMTQVTDEGLKHLAELNHLSWLSLNHTNVTDAQLNQLGKLKSLKILVLTDTAVTPEGKQRMREMLPGCQVF